MFTGRRKPYTERGIARVPCKRCGQPSRFQWQCCANDNRWFGICADCDLELNRYLVFDFLKLPNAKALINQYAKSKCYRCEWYLEGDSGNVCSVQGWGHFDVDKAREIIRKKRRRAVTYSYSKLSKLVNPDSTVTPEHIDHVNTRKPGIVATFKPKDGPAETFVLEGRHRSVKCLLAKRGFRFYELTEEETALIFIGKRAPKGKVFIGKG